MIAGPECRAGARRTAEGGYRHRSTPSHEHQQQCQQQANIRSDFLPRRSSSRGVRCRPATAPPHFVARRIALTEPATPGNSFRDALPVAPRPCAASATGGRRQAFKPLGVPDREIPVFPKALEEMIQRPWVGVRRQSTVRFEGHDAAQAATGPDGNFLEIREKYRAKRRPNPPSRAKSSRRRVHLSRTHRRRNPPRCAVCPRARSSVG